MPLSEQAVLEHIQVSHAALDNANKTLTKQASDKAAYEAAIPDVVEALVKNKRIEAKDREKAANALKDPATALRILTQTADPTVTTEPKPMGSPEGGHQKRASTRYVGQRTGEKTAADIAFETALLGNR